jgi:response regulator NasT
MSDALRILIVDQNLKRAAIIEDGLREAGYRDVIVVPEMHNLLRRIMDCDPDVIFIDLENPNRDVLAQMFQVSRSVQRPIAMFVDNSDTAMIESAIEAGVATYVVDGLKKERIKSILDTTVSRFKMFHCLREELHRTKQALADRKLIDQAKALLMNARALSESDAYELLRRTAMDENLRMAEVARSVINAAKVPK